MSRKPCNGLELERALKVYVLTLHRCYYREVGESLGERTLFGDRFLTEVLGPHSFPLSSWLLDPHEVSCFAEPNPS